jgi:hypothetical protein
MTLPGVQIGTGSAELAKGPRRAARARAVTMAVLLAGTTLKRWCGSWCSSSLSAAYVSRRSVAHLVSWCRVDSWSLRSTEET